MSTGTSLFAQAESLYHLGQTDKVFEYYQLSIKRILKDEIVIAKQRLPPGIQLPDDYPEEVLGMAWRNFVGFFRDPNLNFEQDSPDAYKLLHSFRASTDHSFTRFKSPRAQILLKAMQIEASFALGLLAWDKRDRATAAKRYQEVLDLVATHPPFMSVQPNVKYLERWIAVDVQEIKSNLFILTQNDKVTSDHLQSLTGGAMGNLRKEEIPMAFTERIEGSGKITVDYPMKSATDACAFCGKRAARLPRCSSCKQVAYCSGDCQKADWKKHKVSCKKV
ncbi:hypothetical protein AX16_001980 [Volvariella volvacea WC 439]|nr:hypothetical protein AX16_001980 [Volvariella volvacea WC 439]